MPTVRTDGIELAYEIDGAGEPMLLVMGLGGQLTDWPIELVERLAEHFTVIRFDNRDIGLSSRVDAAPPTRADFAKALVRPNWVDAPYDLSDMAGDTAGLIDELDLGPVHIVGMSMGGMIAQLVTLDHPERVRSLCSIMSNTGNPRTGRPTPRVMSHLARQNQSPDRATATAGALDFFAMISGSDWEREAARVRLEASMARSFDPAGVMRQSLAIAVSPDRTERLRTVRVPTLVIHGLDDTLVRPSGGMATARAIPHSRLLMFPGMGHDLPATRHDEITAALMANCARVGNPQPVRT